MARRGALECGSRRLCSGDKDSSGGKCWSPTALEVATALKHEASNFIHSPQLEASKDREPWPNTIFL